MTEFRSGDRVIVTNARGGEVVGTVKGKGGSLAFTDLYVVEFDLDGRTISLPATLLRHKGSSASIAKGIVDKLQEIEKLRNQVDRAFGDLIGLLALDGQPEYEQRRFENMQTAHRVMLHRDLVAEQTAWEGYYEARKRG